MRTQYSRANQNERNKMAQLYSIWKTSATVKNKVDRTTIQVRKLEKQTIK